MAKRKEIEAKIKELQNQLGEIDEARKESLVKKAKEKVKEKVESKPGSTELEKELEKVSSKIPDEFLEEIVEDIETEEAEKIEGEPEVKPEEPKKAEPDKAELPIEVVEKPNEDQVAQVKPLATDIYRPDGPGKAYKYWDFEKRFYVLTTDLWAAMQAGGNTWEPIWVWFEKGQINHVLTKKEIQKYLP